MMRMKMQMIRIMRIWKRDKWRLIEIGRVKISVNVV